MAETTQSAGGLEILDSIFGYLNKTKNAVFDTYSQWKATFGSENAMDGGSDYASSENNSGWSNPNPSSPATGSANTGLYIGVGVALLAGMIVLTRKK
jgi:LPXTG-motif cell wall-anchored protein